MLLLTTICFTHDEHEEGQMPILRRSGSIDPGDLTLYDVLVVVIKNDQQVTFRSDWATPVQDAYTCAVLRIDREVTDAVLISQLDQGALKELRFRSASLVGMIRRLFGRSRKLNLKEVRSHTRYVLQIHTKKRWDQSPTVGNYLYVQPIFADLRRDVALLPVAVGTITYVSA